MAVLVERYPYDPPVPLFAEDDPYELAVRSQAGAAELLDAFGVLEEIREAVLSYCNEHRPIPAYKPQLLKHRLKPHGWLPEVRVPPLNPELDGLPINERYDLFKFIDKDEAQIGVAIEMDNWMVHRDLLKFRRGFERGQIAVGAIIQPNYRETYYCFEHFRLLNEPLFSQIPILYCCPRGPGLREPPAQRRLKYREYLMPRTSA